MPGTWPRPSSAISRSSRPSICPSIDPQSTPSFTSSRPSPPTRSTRSSPSATFSPAISSKQQPEKPLSGFLYRSTLGQYPGGGDNDWPPVTDSTNYIDTNDRAGPNLGCGPPVLPLSNKKTDIL